MFKLRKKKHNMVLIEKPQKLSALSPGEINKHEHLSGEEILPSNQK